MSLAFSTQVCRIVVPEKLADRFLISGILQQKEGLFIGDQVILTYILEITKPWFPSSRVFPQVLETLTTGHATLKPGEGLGDQFELLLKAVNEQLNRISEMGETDWIGNLNGIIMVLSEDQLHFSQTGRCPAYLLQKNRIRQITDESNEHDPHPLKTFSNLASGTLQENDYILVSNQELYNEISLDALRRIMNNNTPYQACQAIARELKKQKNLAISPLITHVISKGEAENKTLNDPTEIILEEELQGPFKKFQRKLQPFFSRLQKHGSQAGQAGVQLAKQTHEAVKTTVIPKASELFKKGISGAKSLKNQLQNQLVKQKDEPVLPMVEVISPRTLKQCEPLVETISPHQVTQERLVIPLSEFALDSEIPIGLMSTEAKTKTTAVSALKNVASKAKQTWSVFAYKKVVALVLGIILLISTIVIAFRHHAPIASKTTINTNAATLQDITNLTKKATTAITLKQFIEASREIDIASAEISSLENLTPEQKTTQDILWDQLTVASDLVSQTTRLLSATNYQFTSPVIGITASLPYFYGYTTSSNLLRTGKGDPTQTQATVAIGDTNDSIISLAKSSEPDVAGYALTRKNKVLRIIQRSDQTSLQSVTASTGDFATGYTISSYIGNLYLLDGKSGLLWKYVNSGIGYGKGVSVLDINKFDIKHSVSLAIDGSIYLLKSTGVISKFTSGEQDASFTIKNMPALGQKMVQPLQIITDENMQSIYVLDGGTTSSIRSNARIIEFNKNGDFIRQYGFPKDYTRISSFDIRPKDKLLWVVNNGQISEFSI